MARFGFVGPSYSLQNLLADCQISKGWYLEAVESQIGKSAYTLNPVPGLKTFVAGSGNYGIGGFGAGGYGPGQAPQSTSQMIFAQGRWFAVWQFQAYQFLIEILQNGTILGIGQLGKSTSPASLAYNNASPSRMMIASGGRLFLLAFSATTASHGLSLLDRLRSAQLRSDQPNSVNVCHRPFQPNACRRDWRRTRRGIGDRTGSTLRLRE